MLYSVNSTNAVYPHRSARKMREKSNDQLVHSFGGDIRCDVEVFGTGMSFAYVLMHAGQSHLAIAFLTESFLKCFENPRATRRQAMVIS